MSWTRKCGFGFNALLLLLALLIGCGPQQKRNGVSTAYEQKAAATTVLQWLGVEDAPQPPAQEIDILCDASAGSTCTPETLRNTLEAALPSVAARHSSTVRLWMLGREVADTVQAASVTMDAKVRSGKAERASRDRFVKDGLNMLDAAAAPYFSQHANRSPIAESISKLALYHTLAGAERIIVVISDAKEFSGLGDLECKVPEPAVFISRLDVNRVLVPGSLAGAKVVFGDVNLSHIDGDRCVSTLAAADQVQRIWETALKHAGASEVLFEAGEPILTEKGGAE
jgi:hypothetical protein